jgi:uncharacterized membrane protein YoaK (UPF0700 family)
VAARWTAGFRYLRPGLAIILGAVAVKLLTADLFEVPVWASPALIAAVLAAVAILSIRDRRPGAWTQGRGIDRWCRHHRSRYPLAGG